MRRAYLLIDTDRGRALNTVELLRNMSGIAQADITTGPHQVIAILEALDVCAITDGPIKHIRAMEGIRYITVCFTIKTHC